MYVDRPDWIVVGDCVCCGDTLTVLCRDFNNADIPDVVVCDSCQVDGRNAPVIAELERRAVRGLVRAQPVIEPAAQSAQPIVQADLVEALRLCVASLDQLLPYLAKVPADIGLLNSALIAGRAALAAQGGGE